jgi:hypothetical protein
MYENLIKICLITLSVTTVVVLLIKRFIYFKPSSDFIPYSETYQDISEGNLHGWFIGKKGSKTILICHGNAGNISHRQHLIDPLIELGYSVLIFDYAGYGRSRGIPSESQFYNDASVFTNILLEFTDKDNIVVYGESMGAAVAAYIARKYQINTLIIDSGLPSIRKYISSFSNILGVLTGFIFSEFNCVEFLKGYTGNTLVMHSTMDEIIPYIITDEIRSYSKKTINIKGTHNNRNIPWGEVHSFIQNYKY